jgi:hypothetical protein
MTAETTHRETLAVALLLLQSQKLQTRQEVAVETAKQ